jgi:hypothetical protein
MREASPRSAAVASLSVDVGTGNPSVNTTYTFAPSPTMAPRSPLVPRSPMGPSPRLASSVSPRSPQDSCQSGRQLQAVCGALLVAAPPRVAPHAPPLDFGGYCLAKFPLFSSLLNSTAEFSYTPVDPAWPKSLQEAIPTAKSLQEAIPTAESLTRGCRPPHSVW